ncbi:MAG: hypothetical protein ACREQ5_00205 [Candidatus Dormibacteria bacterium]
MQGSTVCSLHLPNPAARKKAAVRAELARWGLGDTHTDPGECLLRLVSQSSARAQFYAELLQEQYERADAGQETTTLPARISVLVGRAFALNRDGQPVPVSEAVRALVQLEGEERDRLCSFAAKAIAAGLAERQVRLSERMGAMMAEVLRGVLGDPALGLSDDQRAAVPALLREHLSIAS